MTADQLNNRRGWVETSFGQLLSVGQALRMADEAAMTIVGHASNGAVLTLGRTRRLASRAQTLALIARDKGCSLPGCDKPPEHTQRHHIIGWADGGSTDVDNLTLLCGPHHRDFASSGWQCRITDGLPAWTPPSWIDPHRTPRLNHRIMRQ